MSESSAEYFQRMNNWEENFETLQEFIDNLNTPSNASGSLGRVAARTIERMQKEIDELKMIQSL